MQVYLVNIQAGMVYGPKRSCRALILVISVSAINSK